MREMHPETEKEVYLSAMRNVCWEATAPITTEMFLDALHERGYAIGIVDWS